MPPPFVYPIISTMNDNAFLSLVLSARADSVSAPAKDPRLLSPLCLAYVGDTLYDLFIRTLLIESTDYAVKTLHTLSAQRVCAKAQAEAFFKVELLLTEEELAIFKRGRNSHLGTVPKNAEIGHYRTATGFEALIGYLFLSKQDARLAEMMKAALSENAHV